MDRHERIYAAIDLKSFYASVECVDRGLDPLNVNLVVADASRTEKTICLAVSPALKGYGIPGRARLFEVNQKVREINDARKRALLGRPFTRSSFCADELQDDPTLELGFIAAPPRMSKYMQVSADIYKIYLQYFAPEDLHVYSIDEVFMDVTDYLPLYRMTPRELVQKVIEHILGETGVTATAGIGTNLYLCKVALDVEAKKIPPDANGVRIAELDEMTYRQQLWGHRPITDFWRVGKGIARRLEKHKMRTMGDVAVCSLEDEALLYKLFGRNAELLIDHAWGYEPCTIAQIKDYKPSHHSLGAGQVLKEPYSHGKARLVLQEMAESLSFDLLQKRSVTDFLVITVGYDACNLSRPEIASKYHGEIKKDFYGRPIPKHAHGTIRLGAFTSSATTLRNAAAELFDRIVDPLLFIRRMSVCAGRIVDEDAAAAKMQQLSFFDEAQAPDERGGKERALQEATLMLQDRFGKNALFRASDLLDGATRIERNGQIGGHRA